MKRKYESWLIPNYGCASFNGRGIRCGGSDEIDRQKYCENCLGYDKRSDKKQLDSDVKK